jgi:hypothetical protein
MFLIEIETHCIIKMTHQGIIFEVYLGTKGIFMINVTHLGVGVHKCLTV